MTSDLEKISRGFEKAFEQAGDVRVETDAGKQRRARRQRELSQWTVDTGRSLAAEEGIELDDPRLAVIFCLRAYYLDHGPADNGRELGDMLDARFHSEGGRAYLRQLFPGGPVAQGMKIAGLPVPEYTEDTGFGTAR